jgi:hypothetical protein
MISDDLKLLCLELAATAQGDPVALMTTVGKIRLVCGYHYGRKGQPLADAELAAEVLIAQVLAENDALKASGGVQ